jgi:exodeoxyribonuclease III
VRLATWNVNSIRSRVDRVIAWLDRADIDVLAIQETKCRDDQFPSERFEEAGYEVAHVGFNQWNGVAIASRIGRALDDPHYEYKLQWLAALRDSGARWLAERPDAKIALVGDWNIAPTDDDVWSPDFFTGKTHVSQPERDAFTAMTAAGFTDVMRPFAPGPGVYTYWDYTQLRFPRKEGMRIDFILASPALAATVTDAGVDREERKGKAPSDHAPVVAEISD